MTAFEPPRARLSTVCRIQNGYAFDSERFSTEEGTPLIRIRDLRTNRPSLRYVGEHPEGYSVHPGNLLIGMDGEFRCYKWSGPVSLLNQRVCRLVPDRSRLCDDYLRYVLDSFLREIEDRTTFTTVKHLSSRDVEAVEIPLPDVAEQERIATRLTEQLAAVDAARTAAQARLAAAEALPAAYLREVFEGAEAAAWEQYQLRDLVRTPIHTGISKPTDPMADKQCLTLSAVRGRTLDLSACKRANVTDAEADGNWILPGRFYVVRGNGNRRLVGRGAFAPDTLPQRLIFPDLLFQLDFAESIDPAFFWCLWSSEGVRKEIEALAQTATGIYKINTANLNGLPLRIPPIEEQQRLARQLSPRLAEAESLAATIREELTAIDALPAALLREAFHGDA